ncbi:MAG: transglutaminase N-terminal domain-containing protein, partial [Verrucomicrobiota bacterium]
MNELRLAPEESSRQSPGNLKISLEPGAELKESRDLFGNLVHYFEVEGSHEKLVIHAETEVETHKGTPLSKEAYLIPLPDIEAEDLDARAGDEFVKEFTNDSTFIQKNPETWREAIDLQLNSEKSWGALIEKMSNHIFESCRY